MEDCIFCKIIGREIPAEIVYEDADTLAFLDIRPRNLGHTLVVPKQHTRNIFDTSEATLDAMMHTIHTLAPAIRDAMGAEGLNINSNHEPAAGQDVFHFHFHIIPRFASDDFKSAARKKYAEGEAAAVGAKIRTALK